MFLSSAIITVHLENLRHNLKTLLARHPSLMPVIKADAYGHGVVAVVDALKHPHDAVAVVALHLHIRHECDELRVQRGRGQLFQYRCGQYPADHLCGCPEGRL